MTIGHVMMDLTDLTLTPEERELLQHPQVGGVILFSRNYESKKQLKLLTQQIHQCNPNLLISADHEGGRVQRFRTEFTLLPPFAKYGEIYNQNPKDALLEAEKMAYIMASELKEVGVDFSFTPVLDVDIGISQVIGDRSFHHTVEAVIDIGRAFIQGMHRANMPATGKHYPGHGATALDSHFALPIDTRDYNQIAQTDLQPFVQLGSLLNGIMPAHVLYESVDKQYPACFSPFWLRTILREQLQFQGVIFSDDITMEGAKIIGDYVQRSEKALLAGCDMVLVCNNRSAIINVLDKLSYQDVQSQQRLLQFKSLYH